MGIHLNKDFYKGKENSAVCPLNVYIGEDGEIYPNRSCSEAEEKYPQVRTVQEEYPAEVQQGEVRNIPENREYLPAVKRKRSKEKTIRGIVLAFFLLVAAAALLISMKAENNEMQLPDRFDSEEWNTLEYPLFGISAIDLDSSMADTNILIYNQYYINDIDRDMINILFNSSYDASLDSGKLTIEQTGRQKGLMYIYIPQGFDGDLDIASKGGVIDFIGIELNNVKAVTSDSEIYFRNVRVRGDAEIKTVSDKISINESEFLSGGYFRTTKQEITIRETIFKETVFLSNIGADVCIENTSFEDMVIAASKGDITCSAYGNINEYEIRTPQNMYGRYSLEADPIGQYVLNCERVDGEISLEFDGEKPKGPEPD